MMKRKRYTAEQIVTHLRKVEALTAQGSTVAEAVKKLEITEQTYYRWKKQYGGMDRDHVKRLKELEQENQGRELLESYRVCGQPSVGTVHRSRRVFGNRLRRRGRRTVPNTTTLGALNMRRGRSEGVRERRSRRQCRSPPRSRW